MQLTDTQHAILTLIAERIQADGLPPSQTEIARAMGFKSVRAAQYHLEALEAATKALAQGTEAFAAERMNRSIRQALAGRQLDQL